MSKFKTTSYFLEYLLNQKRKFKYSSASRKHYHRQYKKMAEDLAKFCIEQDYNYLETKTFFRLPLKYRSYCKSLIKNRIIK